MSKGVAKSTIQPPLSTKNQKLNQSSALKTQLPKSAKKPQKPEEEDEIEVAVVSEDPVGLIEDWHQHRAMDSAFSSSAIVASSNFAQTLQPKKIARYNSPKGDL